MADPAHRFLTAWKHLEHHLCTKWRSAHRQDPSSTAAMERVLRWASEQHLISADTEDFLQRCREARNAYAHVAFDGYTGPVTLPPDAVVKRLEAVARSLRNPSRADQVAPTAVVCEASTPLRDALHQMRQNDFSQLPYLHPRMGWLLVTRDQVARWLEVEAETDPVVLMDLTHPVVQLADDPRVGAVHPRFVRAGSTIAEALTELEGTLRQPDDEDGGYPAVLVGCSRDGDPRILAPDDLPRMYKLLGR